LKPTKTYNETYQNIPPFGFSRIRLFHCVLR
jgi:hypothetical protein